MSKLYRGKNWGQRCWGDRPPSALKRTERSKWERRQWARRLLSEPSALLAGCTVMLEQIALFKIKTCCQRGKVMSHVCRCIYWHLPCRMEESEPKPLCIGQWSIVNICSSLTFYDYLGGKDESQMNGGEIVGCWVLRNPCFALGKRYGIWLGWKAETNLWRYMHTYLYSIDKVHSQLQNPVLTWHFMSCVNLCA